MALIASGTMGGRGRRCPVCGADHAACGGPTDVVPVDQNVTEAKVSGKLTSIEIRPGVRVKVTEEQARAHEAATKAQRPVANKMRRPASNKKAETEE